MTTKKDTTYNGWKNRQTWNVALWIGNDEPVYRSAVEFMRRYRGRKPYRDFMTQANFTELGRGKTPDGVCWLGRRLSYRELNDMMRELVS